MSTFSILSFITNIILIILCLSLIWPKAIQRYKEHKKQRENQRDKGIQEAVRRYVTEYLEELQND